jgi:hypothetical protein
MNKPNMFPAIALCAALSLAGASHAATITFSPVSPDPMVGDTVEVKIVGQDFVDGSGGTIGGGTTIAWDPAILSLQSYDASVFAGDQMLAGINVTTAVDDAAGRLSNLDVTSLFSGASDPNFDIAVLTFTALAAGTSPLTASIGRNNDDGQLIWVDSAGFTALDINFEASSLAVKAVLLLAAAWLFATGIIGLGLTGRRRARS